MTGMLAIEVGIALAIAVGIALAIAALPFVRGLARAGASRLEKNNGATTPPAAPSSTPSPLRDAPSHIR